MIVLMRNLGKTIKGVVLGAVFASIAVPVNAEDNLRLWYSKPASYWEEALPLGNGRLAAMVSGSVAQDTILLNEDTFWSGSPYNNYNEKCQAYLQQMRDGIQSGTGEGYVKAQKLALKYLVADKSQTSHGQIYESVGRLLLTFPGQTFADEITISGNMNQSSKVKNYKTMA